MIDFRVVSAALVPEGATSGVGRFTIRQTLLGCYLSRASATADGKPGSAALLVPIRSLSGAVGRIAGATSLDFRDVIFEVGRQVWTAPCAVVCLLDEALLNAFSALAIDLASRLTEQEAEKPDARDVSQALAEWERLFRGLKRPTEERELGLWGELTLIRTAPDPNAAIRAWRGPFGATVDFFSGDVAVECKSSKVRYRHLISMSQAERPHRDTEAYVVSLWASPDPVAGRSVRELVLELERQTSEPLLLERALLAAGFSPADGLWTTRFSLHEEPGWFRVQDVPSIHGIDPGVSEVRYVVQLDEATRIASQGVSAIQAKFIGA